MGNIDRREMVIHNILAAMGDTLDGSQMRTLENAVRMGLKGLQLEEECTQVSTALDDNNHIVNVFLASKKLEGCKDKTLEQYRLTARQFFEKVQKNFRDVGKNDVKLYLAYRMSQVNPTTLQNSKRNLSTFFGWLHAEGYIQINPVGRGGMRVPEPKGACLTAEEEVLVRDAAVGMKEAAMIDFLLSTGVRVGELVAMDIMDLDLARGTARFRGEKGSRKYRTVLLDAPAKRHVADYLDSRSDCNPALFVTDRMYGGHPKRMCREAVEKLCKDVGKRAGIAKPLTVHVFRRTFATRLADQGCPLETIQALMGHCQAGTTQRYIAQSDSRVVQAAAKYIHAA